MLDAVNVLASQSDSIATGMDVQAVLVPATQSAVIAPNQAAEHQRARAPAAVGEPARGNREREVSERRAEEEQREPRHRQRGTALQQQVEERIGDGRDAECGDGDQHTAQALLAQQAERLREGRP